MVAVNQIEISKLQSGLPRKVVVLLSLNFSHDPNAAQPQCLNQGYVFFVRNFCAWHTEVADKETTAFLG